MKERASIISTLINIFLSASKFVAGFLTGSVTLIADGVHSGLDILSSVVTWIGVKVAGRESDEKHPYGFYVAETLAGLGVVVLLVVSAIWIGVEGVSHLINPKFIELTFWGYLVVAVSIIANEWMARYKFKVGRETNSLALVVDGEHSRADVVSSIGVLIGLLIIDFIPVADGVIAVLIALYVLYEGWGMGKETIDQLIGVSDEDDEKQITQLISKKGFELSDLKTRRIGSASFAELTIKMDPSKEVGEVHHTTAQLQNELLENVSGLSHVVVQVTSHNYSEGAIKTGWGRKIRWRGRAETARELNIKAKVGNRRILIPVKEGKFYGEFGAPQYLLVDKDEQGNEVQRQNIDNPFFEKEKGGGMKIAKAIGPDEVIVSKIGSGASEKAGRENIKIRKVENYSQISDLL